MSEEFSDEQLVKLCINENKEYFGEIIERYQKKLIRYIKRISNTNNEDVEDILQNSFINVYQGLQGFDNKLKFSSWIYRIVHNQVIDLHRKKISKGRDMVIKIDDTIMNNIMGDFDTINLAEEIITKQYIQMALNKIDIKYKEVIILKYFEEKDYREISDILKKPLNTVATLLNRAKKKLRSEINSLTNEHHEY